MTRTRTRARKAVVELIVVAFFVLAHDDDRFGLMSAKSCSRSALLEARLAVERRLRNSAASPA